MVNDFGDVTVVIDSTPLSTPIPSLKSSNISVLSENTGSVLNETITIESDDKPTVPIKEKDSLNPLFMKGKLLLFFFFICV